jgi:hypothetical protein
MNKLNLIWSQCGGHGWLGSINCVDLSKCVYVNFWYSHCVPTSLEVGLFQQCGGLNYKGPTNCIQGSACIPMTNNIYLSKCLPMTNNWFLSSYPSKFFINIFFSYINYYNQILIIFLPRFYISKRFYKTKRFYKSKRFIIIKPSK